MKKNDININLDLDINESSDIWSFRNKDNKESLSDDDTNKNKSIIDILKQRVTQNLKNLTKKKHIISLENDIKYYEEETKNLNFFKKSIEKELEIFESERKNKIENKNNNNENNLVNINMTLSEINRGNCLFVTNNDLMINLPKNLIGNINNDDIGNEFKINIKEIDSLIPSEDIVAKMHLKFSKNNT